MTSGLIFSVDSYANASNDSESDKPILEQSENETIQGYLHELSNAQAYIGDYVQGFGERLDSFFGSEELDVVEKGSRLTVYTPLTIDSSGNSDSSLNFRAQIDLPKTNHRWKLLISSFEVDEEENINSFDQSSLQRNTTTQAVNTESENNFAGRYLISTSPHAFRYVDIGMKFIDVVEPNPYIKFKNRHKSELSHKIVSRTTHTAYLERDRGFAWESQQVFDYEITTKRLVRSQTTATWWRDDEEVLLNQKFLLFEKPTANRAKAYFIDGNWTIKEQGSGMTSIAVGVNWREKLYKDWLYGEIEPRATWTDMREWHDPLYSIKFMLEMHFYHTNKISLE